jgi:hypothetical protein
LQLYHSLPEKYIVILNYVGPIRIKTYASSPKSQELCGADDSFRTKVKEYKKNPASTTLLTALIVSLLGMSGLPFDPTIATIVVLYILNIGIDVFCEYTEPDSDGSNNLPPGN